jgi:hypothetical protein
LVALVLSFAALTGCSGLAQTQQDAAAVLDPSYQDIIAARLKSTFKNFSGYESFEISEPRWVHAIQGWSWLTCVRFQDHGRRLTYALFLRANTIIDARYAVQTDGCDAQGYGPFGRLGGGGGLDPLH